LHRKSVVLSHPEKSQILKSGDNTGDNNPARSTDLFTSHHLTVVPESDCFPRVTTETQILAAVDSLPIRQKARLMPKLRRRLEDYYDLKAVKRAQAKGVYHAYETVRRDLFAARASR
jgi:hypothetical protein